MRATPLPCHHANVLPYAAYLRVYQPLDAFGEPERATWTSYVQTTDRPSRGAAVRAEQLAALRRVIAVPPIVAPALESTDAYVRRRGGVTFICPAQVRLRSWLAFAGLADLLPAGLAEAFLPGAVITVATREFEDFKRLNPTARPHIRTATWRVPLPWFALFDAAERALQLGEPRGEDGPDRDAVGRKTATPTRTLTYLTEMSQARKRVARGLAAVRHGLGDGEVSAYLEDLGRWLEEFHPHALIELDYGGLVHLLDDESLLSDQSVAEVNAALTGLESDEPELASAMHKRVATRWRAVQAKESAN